jgi:hypothetical protein
MKTNILNYLAFWGLKFTFSVVEAFVSSPEMPLQFLTFAAFKLGQRLSFRL